MSACPATHKIVTYLGASAQVVQKNTNNSKKILKHSFVYSFKVNQIQKLL